MKNALLPFLNGQVVEDGYTVVDGMLVPTFQFMYGSQMRIARRHVERIGA